MLVAVCGPTGSPGVTSTALVLAAAWPRPAVLVEMDPAGADLALIAAAADSPALAPSPNVSVLAYAVRAGTAGPGVVTAHTQRLACGVQVVPGVPVAEAADGLTGLWPAVADACRTADVDVVADLGRINTTSPVLPVTAAAEVVVVVGAPSLPGVVHLRDRLAHLVPALPPASDPPGPSRVVPVLVSPDRHAAANAAETDWVLAAAAIPVAPTAHVAADGSALARLMAGEAPSGRLGRTLLLRSARALARLLTTNPADEPEREVRAW